MTKRLEALLCEIMENGLVFDMRTDTNDNGGGKVREYRCPARHLTNARYAPYPTTDESAVEAAWRPYALSPPAIPSHPLDESWVALCQSPGLK